MQQRGRKSSAALAVIDENTELSHALISPGSLSPAERVVWMALVNSKPGDFFGTEHIPIMVEYVRHVCRGHVIDAQLQRFDPEWMATDDGLKRYTQLVVLGHKVAAMVNRLATAMRITHQAIYRGEKASLKQPKAKKVWQRPES